mmetsp:Transcript_37816/g.77141  ORF Transcript_37816/g.77141 Transcript_37816/m.77141 type:complete len:104 (+) Transcript_37816:2128-2439(+)
MDQRKKEKVKIAIEAGAGAGVEAGDGVGEENEAVKNATEKIHRKDTAGAGAGQRIEECSSNLEGFANFAGAAEIFCIRKFLQIYLSSAVLVHFTHCITRPGHN